MAEPIASTLGARWPTEVLWRAQGRGGGLRLFFFDVDGVLTDGRIWLDADGENLKAFHALDGHGLKLLQSAGIEPVIITGRASRPLDRRLADLGLAGSAHQGVKDKLAVAQAVLAERSLTWEDVGAMGDDWPDLPLLDRAALAIAPPNAHADVLAVAHWVTRAPGGAGAAREACDLALVAAGRYDALRGATRQTLDAR